MQQQTTSFKTLVAAFALATATLFAPDALAQSGAATKTTSASVIAEQPSSSLPITVKENSPAPAAEYEAPQKPLPPLERVGVEASEPFTLTLNEAIRLALENNNDIEASRIDVEMGEHDLTAARGAYDPRFASEFFIEHSKTPVTSFLGGSSGALKQTDVTSSFSLSGNAPWAGGSYNIGFSSSRLSTNNFFNSIDPAQSTKLSLSYTQPLVRGRRTDDTRRQIEIAKKNLSLTDVQFRQRATEVITRVEQAYWELVYALKNLQVQTDAVKQTRAQVETNKRQVKQGVLAPIDVIEAEAQVKSFEQQVYRAQEEVTRSENALKTLLLPDRSAELWSRALLPVTPVSLEAPRFLLSDALSVALANRLELAELQTAVDINHINTGYFRDQVKPQVDLTLSYSSEGLAGNVNDNSQNPLLSDLTVLEQRVADLSAIAGLPKFQTTSLAPVTGDLRGGYGRSLRNLLAQDNPTVRVGVSISLPLKNRTAKARLGHLLAEGRRLETLRAKAEQLIEADVRNSMQAVRSVEARLAAAAAERTAAEEQYTSEQRKFQAGMSTVFLVLQRQTDLVTARGRELQSQTDLNKAISDFQRAMGNTFRYRSVAVISEGHRLQQIAGPNSDTTDAETTLPAKVSARTSTTGSGSQR